MTVASTPRQELRLFQNSRADLVILDMTLPEMGGFEVCRWLRAGRGRLRAKLGDDSKTPAFIRSLRGWGYLFGGTANNEPHPRQDLAAFDKARRPRPGPR